MSESSPEPSDQAAPDEVVILPVEEFLELIKSQFEQVPFVALNLTRSLTFSPSADDVGHTMHTVVAIGFEAEEMRDVPGYMGMLTNYAPIFIGVQNDQPEIQSMIENALFDGKPLSALGDNQALPVMEAAMEHLHTLQENNMGTILQY